MLDIETKAVSPATTVGYFSSDDARSGLSSDGNESSGSESRRYRFVVAICCCPLGSILCIHAAKDTSVVTRSSCFSPKKGRTQRSKARKNAEHAVLDEAVERATNEWSALGVTDMRVSPFVHALRTPLVHGCLVYFVAGASEFTCRGS